ncbi:single-stranded-DNA-specific exonuclease RecJ [Thomasclavelia cocleata]|uniref:Single-stranded-DNA-specific exonuclease RecJ n=2 Tax=Thomasclavelia cocleata TaxID=69824 RepID=A0A1I0DBH6_9FIRM|nr:single-stranded-DNA-specific exonuclease RecJ [Thomasclavelia cocleata]MCR1960389.1 single-stranded-DNA-specific exonuclease RecJ [Thomasclavelia cocleata]NDO41928.1 single-stranded-DNA-specific exonuclease RecJ [Thomasclavelia cocleata]PJN79990.1 single-stranded-DNA-specific exonuclease RecJ [Thomasclavelia cocleata]SET29644.1 exonuclease RecJ [Thomasclavelia cocleata]GFI40090.1 single-stranded-DNA-specific exonuclease RecJ [Thomasclavelia cocleata]
MEWQIINDLDYKHYMQKYNINSLLAKIFAYKNYSQSQIELMLSNRLIYHDFSLFSEAEITLERIYEAIENKEKICIYGDYDCDGILATSILVEAFRQLGVDVGYHIPNRLEDGYGLNCQRVEQIASKGYSLIITVDNGVKAYDAVERANELGVDVIITDHHNCEEELPEAFSIIHTKISPDYPYKEISGGFVAYKLASALLKKHDKYLFCLAAITTISDMMPLLDENRALVKRALEFMKENKFTQLELLLGNNQKYSVTSIGFIIAPKINSFGRLSDLINPNHLVKYFRQDASIEILKAVSSKAVEINAKRQEMTNKQYQNVITTLNSDEQFLYSYQNEIHEGLIGLVAGKYTRQYNRPSFVMSLDTNKNIYKGSARGIEGLSLNNIFKQVEDILESYGGHALAGGFSVKFDNVEKLKQKLTDYLNNQLENYQPPLTSVLEVSSDEISQISVKQLEQLEPLGNGNEEMYFYAKDLPVKRVILLSNGKHLRFDLDLPNTRGQALFFNHGDIFEKYKDVQKINVIGKFNINVYNNMESVNLIIEAIK